MKQGILRSSFYLLVAQSFAKIISFLYTVFLARILGVEGFGLYVTALAYFALISTITDFGFNRYLIREGAKNEPELRNYVWNVSILRFLLSLLIFAVFALVLNFLDVDKSRVNLSVLAMLAVLPQSIAITLDAALLAKRLVLFSAMGIVILASANILIGANLIRFGLGVNGAIVGFVFAQVLTCLFLLFLIREGKIYFLSKISFKQIKDIIYGSLPYGILGILGLLYFRIDTLLLSYLKGSHEVGIYGAAYKFLEAIIFVPSAVSAVIFPIISKLHEKSVPEIKKIYGGSLTLLAILSLPVFLIFFFILPLIIKFLLPNYISSIEALRILSLAIPFMFIQVPAVTVLFSSEKFLTKIIFLSILTLVFNITLNLIFIPQYGYIASSWITVASEILSFFIFFIFLKKFLFR